MMRESKFQGMLIKRLKEEFPGCIVLKNDANYIQGFPDLLVLIGDTYIALEVKASEAAPLQPNQLYYIDLLKNMSQAYIIHPGNEDFVIERMHAYIFEVRS